MSDDERLVGSQERIANRRAAMDLAHHAASLGDPIAGAFFGFIHETRRDPYGAFIDDFYDVDAEDYSDDERPF